MVSLGRQLPLTSRRATVKAALYGAAQIEQAWLQRNADQRFSDSIALMALIGESGCGKYNASKFPSSAGTIMMSSHAMMCLPPSASGV